MSPESAALAYSERSQKDGGYPERNRGGNRLTKIKIFNKTIIKSQSVCLTEEEGRSPPTRGSTTDLQYIVYKQLWIETVPKTPSSFILRFRLIRFFSQKCSLFRVRVS